MAEVLYKTLTFWNESKISGLFLDYRLAWEELTIISLLPCREFSCEISAGG